MKKHTTVDAYIADFPPEALELISYGMPGYKLNGTGMVCRVQKPNRFLPVYFGCKIFFGKIRPSEIVERHHSVAHSLDAAPAAAVGYGGRDCAGTC